MYRRVQPTAAASQEEEEEELEAATTAQFFMATTQCHSLSQVDAGGGGREGGRGLILMVFEGQGDRETKA